jgi:hypothetical protein
MNHPELLKVYISNKKGMVQSGGYVIAELDGGYHLYFYWNIK